jgi:hypothetical protein
MELQVKRLHAAAESLTRAAAQIKSVEEAVHKSAHAAETLPYRMQEKLAEFNEALAEKENSDHEALEQEVADLRAADSAQLKAAAEKIQKAVTDWTALEVATRKQLTAAEAALAKIHAASADAASAYEAKLKAATDALDAKLAEFKHAARSSQHAPAAHAPAPKHEPAPEPVVEKKPEPAVVESAPVETPAAVTTPEVHAEPVAVVEEPKPKKPRAPRKPKVEEQPLVDTIAPMAVESVPAAPAVAEPEPAISSDDDSAPASAAPAESSASSDGATRLLATAYIGIGNKLFIRGDGPGLSWDKGVPMQFVSIGKWGWATHDATTPFRAKLYKNDETTGMTGEIEMAPGQHVEITALF